MALGDEKKKKIYEKRNATSKYYVSDANQTKMSASYASAEHLRDNHTFEVMKPFLYTIQLLEEDIDEIRRFATGSGEINVDGGVF